MIGGQTTGEKAAQLAAEQNAKAVAAQMRADEQQKKNEQLLNMIAHDAIKQPKQITVGLGQSGDKELEAMTALVGVMDALYPQRDRDLGEGFKVGRIAQYFHSRYGIAQQS